MLSKYIKQNISKYYIETIIIQTNNILIREEVDYKTLNNLLKN